MGMQRNAHEAGAHPMGKALALLMSFLLVVLLCGTPAYLGRAFAEGSDDVAEGDAADAPVADAPTAPDAAAGEVPEAPAPAEPSVIVETPVPPATDALASGEGGLEPAAEAAGTPTQVLAPSNVYVYVRVVDNDGAPLTKEQLSDLGVDVKVNGNGWLTMGYLPNVPIGGSPWMGEHGSAEQLSTAIAYLPTLVPLLNDQGQPVNGQIDPFASDIYWELSGANGANDYVPAGTLAWHLSGAIPMDMLRDYEVNAVNAMTLEEIAPPEVVAATIGERVPIQDVGVDEFEGYHPVAAGPNVLTVGPYESRNHFVFFYQPEEAVIAFETNGGSEVEPLVGVTDEAIADTAMPMPSKPGYTLKGWYADAQLTGDAVEELPGAFPPGTTVYYADWTPASGNDAPVPPAAPQPPSGSASGPAGSVDVAAPIGADGAETAQVANLSNYAGLAQTGDREVQAVAVLLVVAAGSVALLGAFALRRRAHDEHERRA